MAEYTIQVMELEVTVEYSVSGSYERESRTSPAEYPEVEIECFRLEKELATLLGISETLDSTRIEGYIDDMGALVATLLQEWEEDQEPDFDREYDDLDY